MIDSWLKAINEGKFVGCVMIDFRKAFDLVDHAVLLKKLEIYKCGKSALSWFKSYLSTRTQKVSIKHSKSDTENITCGVPQGSILGPLLFLIFINDLPLKLQNIVASTDLYADDTTIYDIQYDKQVLENNLQRSLVLLQQWCKENGMLINTDKTKVMFITSRQKRCNLNDASFHLKCNNIYNIECIKVSTHLWLLSQISSYLSVKDRLLFYNAYICPHFDYCSVIYMF